MQTRYYQDNAIKAAMENNNGYINLCTGSGKSVVISKVCQNINDNTLILQPNIEILEQNANKLKGVLSSDIDIAIYSASAGQKNIAKYTLATIGSVINNIDKFLHFKNIIIDECHLVNAKAGSYRELYDKIKPTKIIGFTGTPFRTSSQLNYNTNEYETSIKFLHKTRPKIFNKILYSYSAKDALKDNFISPVQYFSSEYKNTSLTFGSSDFTESSIFDNNKRNDIYSKMNRICKKLLSLSNNFRGCLIFVAGIEEAINVETLMQIAGYNVASITSKTPKQDRKQILNDFKSGAIKFVINVGVLTVGFDYPELDTIIVARPTFSLGLWWQIVGRVIRTHKDKPYGRVYDLCGNVERLGKMDEAEFIDIDTQNCGLKSGNLMLIKPSLSYINTFQTNVKIPKLNFNVEFTVKKLLQSNRVSVAEKEILQKKRGGNGNFANKYLAEIPHWNVKWLQENGYEKLALSIIEAQLLTEKLYKEHDVDDEIPNF